MLQKSKAVSRLELRCQEFFKAVIHLDALSLLLTAEFSVSQQPKDGEQDQSIIPFQWKFITLYMIQVVLITCTEDAETDRMKEPRSTSTVSSAAST